MNSSSDAQNNLVSPWLITVLVIITIILLIFFFPRKNVLKQIKQQQSADLMARNYVNNLITIYPNNDALKLVRVNQNIQLGKLSDAIKEILPFVISKPSTPGDWQALWLYYQIVRTETYALPSSSAARPAGFAKMQSMFDKLYQHFTVGPELIMLATDAIYLNNTNTALILYRKIVYSKVKYPVDMYVWIARLAFGEKDYKLSADAYFIAKQLTPAISDKRKYFILGLKSLQSGNLLPLAQVYAQIALSEKNVAFYNKEICLLIYDIFLATNKINDAYNVAELAVKIWPNDLAWRQKLALVAIWNQKPKIALEQWLLIANSAQTQNIFAIDNGIKLAHTLRDYFTLSELSRLKIKYAKNDENAWNSYIEAQEALGHPQQIINELLAASKTEAKPFYYNKLVDLYHAIGNAQAELEILDLIADKFGTNLPLALRQATILYSTGDIITAEQKLVAVKKLAKNTDLAFWQALGLLSWLTQDFTNARLSYENLNRLGKIDRYTLINLIQITDSTNKKAIFMLALDGWYRYKMEFFLLKILELAPALNEWSTLTTILSQIPDAIKLKLETNSLYYTAQVQLLLKFNKKSQALMVYEQVLQKLPNSIDLKIDYLWFLIDNQYNDVLRKKLIAWENIVFTNTRFSAAYASGCILLNDPSAALKIYKQQFAQNKHDVPWLFSLAFVLEQLNMPSEATLVRRLAWLELLQSTKNITSKEFYNDLLTLALSFNDLELANYVYNFYGINQDIEPWIMQTLALSNNDLGLLNELLAEKLDKLPYRDRVMAATRTGDQVLAQTLAFNGLTEHPKDTLMYQLFTDTMLPASSNFDTETMFVKNGYINGVQEKFSSTLFITPRISITPWANVWRTTSINTTYILAATNYDSSEGMKLAYKHKIGVAALDFGARHGLANFMMLKLTDSYLITSKLNLNLAFGYQQPADETSSLLIAGMKNEAKIGAAYQLTVRDSLSSSFSYKNFNSQDKNFLGKGQVLDVYYNHKFEFGYPDWNASLFSSVNAYQGTGSISPEAQQVIPAGQAVNASFFIPEGFVRYGAGFGFGQGFRDGYTHAWRPFAEASVFEDLGIGFGNYLDIGIAGSVFGRDHLALYYERSSGFTVANQINYTYGARYRLNF